MQVFLLNLVFPKFCPKVGKIPKFRPFFLKVGKIYENLGKSWESEKRWEEEISGNYFLVYFQYKQNIFWRLFWYLWFIKQKVCYMEVKIYNTMLLFYCIEAVILGFSQVWMESPSFFLGFKNLGIPYFWEFQAFWDNHAYVFSQVLAHIFESWEEVGDGRDMMQKQGMTKVVQKCSVYIGLMGFKGIL